MKKNNLSLHRTLSPISSKIRYSSRLFLYGIAFFILIIFVQFNSIAQNPTRTFNPGSYIIDMGQAVQTPQNGLKPYGLVYQLIINQLTPVNWAINSLKVKDGIDFYADGMGYRGGSFIISSERITAQVIALINVWRAKGVIVDGPTLVTFTAPVFHELTSWPLGVLDSDNDGLISPYYNNAEVPTTSYLLNANPTMLAECSGLDVYVLPHADPFDWDSLWISALQQYINNGGYFWAGCHAVSAMESLPGCNFLSNAGLILWDDHGNSTHISSYNPVADASPIMQFIGHMEKATTNGSEQIYVPAAAGWRSTTTLAVYDSSFINTGLNPHLTYTFPNAATILAYGPAYGDTSKGIVMYEAGHSLAKDNKPYCIAAQRAFFNFLLMAGVKKEISIVINYPLIITPGADHSISATVSGGTPPYTYFWSVIGGGTFLSNTTNPTIYTAPITDEPIVITLKVTDVCGRNNLAYMLWINPLPIELLTFSAIPVGQNVQLDWSTASESNNDFFTIQRSQNLLSFENVVNVSGAGSSNTVLFYEATDYDPYDGTSYYRIKQTDLNGLYTYSNTTSVFFENFLDFNIYPNPFSLSTKIAKSDASEVVQYELKIYSASGDEVMRTALASQITTIDTSVLPSGAYFYRILNGNKVVQSGNLVSQQ